MISLWLLPGKGTVSIFQAFLIVSFGTILFGVLWEVFKYFFNITYNALSNYKFDTVKDLLTDVGGGLFAYLCFSLKGYTR